MSLTDESSNPMIETNYITCVIIGWSGQSPALQLWEKPNYKDNKIVQQFTALSYFLIHLILHVQEHKEVIAFLL